MSHAHSILLATDFRAASDEAVTAAATLASALGASVSVLHVLEPVSTGAAAHFYHQQIGDMLLQQVTEAFASQNVHVRSATMKSGPLADSILSAARGFDLVVLGAGEKDEHGRFALGPIAEAVVTHAHRPVLAVRLGEPKLRFERIVCAVDHSPASAEALREAIRLAKLFQGQLTVLSVVPQVSWLAAAIESGQLTDVQHEHASHWKSEFDQFLDSIDFDGVDYKSELLSGIAHDMIVTAVKAQDADLIVLGTTGRSGIGRLLLGSTTRRVLRRLPCSLLTVRGSETVGD